MCRSVNVALGYDGAMRHCCDQTCVGRRWAVVDGRRRLVCPLYAPDAPAQRRRPRCKPRSRRRKKLIQPKAVKCSVCSATFRPKSRRHRFCSDACRHYTPPKVAPEPSEARPSKWAKEMAARARRKARVASAPGRGVTKQARAWVLELYGAACLVCGKRVLPYNLDHVIPLVSGGRHDPDNLQPLCWRHNRRKGTQTIDHRPFPYEDPPSGAWTLFCLDF